MKFHGARGLEVDGGDRCQHPRGSHRILDDAVILADRAEPDITPMPTVLTTSQPSPTPAPTPAPPPPTIPQNTTPPHYGPIILRTAATPERVKPNATADIRVTAFDGRYAPIENASVRIECAAGTFTSTNTSAVEGRTDADGAFHTVWQAPQNRGSSSRCE